jgi:hypothetical protein
VNISIQFLGYRDSFKVLVMHGDVREQAGDSGFSLQSQLMPSPSTFVFYCQRSYTRQVRQVYVSDTENIPDQCSTATLGVLRYNSK